MLLVVQQPGTVNFHKDWNWRISYILDLDNLKTRLTIVDVLSNVWLYDHIIGAWVSSWYIEFLDNTHLLIDRLRSDIAGTSGNLRRLLREYRLSQE